MELFKLGFENTKRKRRLEDLAAGAFAGGVAGFAVKPLDTIADTKVQGGFLGEKFSPKAKHSVKQQLKEIYTISKKHYPGRFGGLRGYFAGGGFKVLKIAPATALSFMLYGLAKEQLNRSNT